MRLFLSSRHIYYGIFFGVLWTSILQARPSIVTQAITALEKEDWEQAKTCIDLAVEEAAILGRGEVWYYRGAIYEKLLRNQVATEDAPQLFEMAMAAYQKALSLTPVNSQYHSFARINLSGLWAYFLDRARRYYRQEAFENAIQQLQYCKQIKPEDPYSYLYTAIAAHQKEDFELALTSYNLYLERAHVVPAAVYRGLAHLTASTLKDSQKALEITEKALSKYPFDRELCYEQLQIYAGLEQVDTLSEILQQRTVAAPHEAFLHYQLGYCYAYQGKEKQALQQYQEAIKCAPKQIESICQQGILHYNHAAQLTHEIQGIPEDEASQKLCKSKIMQMETLLQQALSYLEQAYKLNPRDPFIIKHLHSLYVHLHRPAQADKMARRLRRYG